MTPLVEHSGSVVEAVMRLQIERDEALVRLAEAEQREQDIARRMYRRGYLAGRAAKRRGEPAVTNPESRGRRETREMLG